MIKKILITILVTASFFSIAHAQQSSPNKFEFGASTGYNIASITNPGHYLSTTQSESRFNAGISGEYLLSAVFGIKIKAIYDQKGYRGYPFLAGREVTTALAGPVSSTNYHLNYLTIPVTANFYFGKMKNWYVNAGPYIGFVLKATDTRYQLDDQKTFNSNDAGVSLGFGIKFAVTSKTKLFIEFDGQHGFTNILKVINSTGSSFENARSAFNVGLNFK